ncbi:four helix bundle protein [Proteiniphilum sp.]|uniref:four helix bundle protein n=1 Tax=Proteiniphilum sp. TaxID=1926877 RepID=UPI002B21AD21|nr:four helix bundle protein [Proteiniphilum sp.]MEA5128188.1 four helix bundle protein [Proteiniphilum sp.]
MLKHGGRRYEKAFIAKLSDAEGEAAETQVWLDFVLECGYINEEVHTNLNEKYNIIIGMIINMIHNSSKWIL